MIRIYSIILVCLLCCFHTKASDSTLVEKSKSFELFEWGLTFGYGFVNESLPEGGRYEPILFLANLEFHIHKKTRDPESKHFFLLYSEPQFSPVFRNGGIKDWELGCNIGAKYLIKMNERNGLFFYVGSGPHYISLDHSAHQSKGFAFSDNFGLGYQREFNKDIKMNFGYRYRHVSNLDIKLPNDGLGNHFFTIGFKKEFAHRVQKRKARKLVELELMGE